MQKPLMVKFGKSTSQNYAYAVEFASKFDTYEVNNGEEKNVTHTVVFSPEQINNFFDLYDLVGRWKSCSIYIDGELIPPGKVKFLWCFREREKSYNKKEYCYGRDNGYSINNFGCRETRVEVYSWHGLKGYGTMDRQGVFHVNKDKLRHDIYKNIDDFKMCPALNLTTIEKGIDEIPERIDPKQNRDWEYVTDYDDGKEIAVAVRKKDKKSGAVIKDHNEIKIDLSEIASTRQASKSTGCLFLLGLPVIIYSVYSLFV